MAVLLSSGVLAFSSTLDQQGVLRNQSTGAPITGVHEFNVSFYNASDSSLLYTDSQDINLSTNGVWNYFIALTNPFIFGFTHDVYFTTRVDGEGIAMTNLTAVPYSILALKANDTDFLAGLPASSYLGGDYNDSWINGTIDSKVEASNSSMKSYVDALNGTWNADLLDGQDGTYYLDNTDTFVNATCPAGEAFNSINGTVYGCTAISAGDTNETTRVNNIVGLNCSSGDFISGRYDNGTAVCGTPAGGSGNPFDQDLNTTDSVNFTHVTLANGATGLRSGGSPLTTYISFFNENIYLSSESVNRISILSNGTDRVVFNEPGVDVDHRFEGTTDANLLFLDASNNSIGVGTASPTEKLHVAGNILADDNATVENLKLETDPDNHRIYDNSTCVIITGDTSTLTIC